MHPSNTINGKSLRTKLLDMIGMYKEVLCLSLFLVLRKVKLLQIKHVCVYNQVLFQKKGMPGLGFKMGLS